MTTIEAIDWVRKTHPQYTAESWRDYDGKYGVTIQRDYGFDQLSVIAEWVSWYSGVRVQGIIEESIRYLTRIAAKTFEERFIG